MTITEAWENADRVAFERMRDAVGDDQDNGRAFRGYLPADGINVWYFTSGGNQENTIYRLSGPNPQFCSLWFSARAVCAFADRSKAMLWVGRVYKFLSDTTNLRNTGNIQELRLSAHAGEPTLTDLPSGAVAWVIEIPMELVFATGTTL